MTSLFISYRRSDSREQAKRLSRHLNDHFGENTVFIDIDDIEGADIFPEVLGKAVGSSDLVLAVIGPGWSSVSSSGRSRLEDPADYVRLELAAALDRSVPILPILIGGASMPGAHELPDPLKPLATRQAMQLRQDSWEFDVGHLVAAVHRITHRRSRTLLQRLAVTIPGLALLLVLALTFPDPTPFQHTLLRIALALAAAGVAATIPGLLTFTVGPAIRTGLAMAMFAVVYFFNPAGPLVDELPVLNTTLKVNGGSVSFLNGQLSLREMPRNNEPNCINLEPGNPHRLMVIIEGQSSFRKDFKCLMDGQQVEFSYRGEPFLLRVAELRGGIATVVVHRATKQ